MRPSLSGAETSTTPPPKTCKEGYSRSFPEPGTFFFCFFLLGFLPLVVFTNLFPSPKKAKTLARGRKPGTPLTSFFSRTTHQTSRDRVHTTPLAGTNARNHTSPNKWLQCNPRRRRPFLVCVIHFLTFLLWSQRQYSRSKSFHSLWIFISYSLMHKLRSYRIKRRRLIPHSSRCYCNKT